MPQYLLKLRKLAVGNECFAWEDEALQFSQIRSLKFRWNKTDHYVNAVKMETQDDALLEIELNNGETIGMELGKGLVAAMLGDGAFKNECEQLSQIHRWLSAKSFDSRYHRYATEIKLNGHLSYEGAKLYPDGRILFNNRERNLRECSVTREPFALHIAHRQDGIKKALWGLRLWDSDIHLSTERDSDVLFALLANLHGIRWNQP